MLALQDFPARRYKCLKEIKMLSDPVSSFINDHLDELCTGTGAIPLDSQREYSERARERRFERCRMGTRPGKEVRIHRKTPSYQAPPHSACAFAEVPGAPVLLIYGHYDVQPPDPLDEWQTPPFSPDVRDGYIYARGATDDKGQLFFTYIKAIEAVLGAGQNFRSI